jgi:hypothetical protein
MRHLGVIRRDDQQIEDLVEHVGGQSVEIEFDDGEVRPAAIAYCSLKRTEERVYFFNLDPSLPSYGEGLCFARLSSIRSIRSPDNSLPEPHGPSS